MPIHGDGGHAAVVKEFYSGSGWIIAVGDNGARQKESRLYKEFAVAVHPSAVISPTAIIGEGTVIMAGAVVQARAKVGRHCIVNTNAVCDHDSVLGDFVHLAPSAVVCGGVRVGEGALIGVNASVVPNTIVPAWYLVKAGEVFRYSNIGDRVQRFWVKAEKSAGCWNWMALRNPSGYGVVNFKNKTRLAHRVAWELTHGEIPVGMYACHTCDNPSCINPDHLFLGTQADNMRDMMEKGRSTLGRKRS